MDRPDALIAQQAAPTRTAADETPSAPLPPAVYPGMLLLLTLGGVKMTLHARRRLVRG